MFQLRSVYSGLTCFYRFCYILLVTNEIKFKLIIKSLTATELTVSRLFADISKAGVETEPRLFEVVSWCKMH